jgi:hypothetical protein
VNTRGLGKFAPILIGLLSRWSILFINGDFYGSNLDTIQLTTGDILQVDITKDNVGEEALILYNAKLV